MFLPCPIIAVLAHFQPLFEAERSSYETCRASLLPLQSFPKRYTNPGSKPCSQVVQLCPPGSS